MNAASSKPEVESLGRLFGNRVHGWSDFLFRRLRKACLAASHPLLHVRMQTILAHPSYAALRRALPGLRFKYLEPRYLLHGLTPREGARCMLQHYRLLLEKLPHAFLRALPAQEALLLKLQDDHMVYTVTMGLSIQFPDEGELSLNLRADGELLFVLSFTVVPGEVIRSQAAQAILITRLQGEVGQSARIRLATKAMHSMEPAVFLLSIVQGIAEAWGIGEMAGVCARRHRSYREKRAAEFMAAYDEFFLKLGAVQNQAGLFVSPLPRPQKPLSQVKRSRRPRTKAKRAFKRGIAEETARLFRELAQRNTEFSPPRRVQLPEGGPRNRLRALESDVSAAAVPADDPC